MQGLSSSAVLCRAVLHSGRCALRTNMLLYTIAGIRIMLSTAGCRPQRSRKRASYCGLGGRAAFSSTPEVPNRPRSTCSTSCIDTPCRGQPGSGMAAHAGEKTSACW